MAKRRLRAEAEDRDEDEAEEEKGGGGGAPSSASTATAAAARSERRRKQCRISQRRYRDKKGSAEYNLRLDINDLRESVERLKQARGLLESKIQLDRRALRASVLKAVEQYYAMFRFGLHDPSAGEHVRKCYEIQVRFLRAFMDPQVRSGAAVGVDGVLEQWRRYSRYHSALRVELVASEVFGSDSESPIVKASGTLTVTLNRATLEHVFPRALADERLAQALIGQQVAYTTCTEYVFDEKVQVIRQDFTVDFLAGLGAVLRDPFVTADVLKQARIAHSSHLGAAIDENGSDQDDGFDDQSQHRHEEAIEDDADTATTVSHDEDPAARGSTASSSSARLALQFIMS